MTTSSNTRHTSQQRRPHGRRRRDSLVGEDGKVDYKDVQLMRRVVNERGKLTPGRRLRMSAKMQRRVAVAVKRARHLALIPMAPNHNYVTNAVQPETRSEQSENPPAEDQETAQPTAEAASSEVKDAEQTAESTLEEESGTASVDDADDSQDADGVDKETSS